MSRLRDQEQKQVLGEARELCTTGLGVRTASLLLNPAPNTDGLTDPERAGLGEV